MNPKSIHETVLQTLINSMNNVVKFVGDSIDASDKKRLRKTRNTNIARSNSISRASSGLIFTYPTLCSTSLNIKQCMMVSKALERRNVTLLQILLAANQWTKQNLMDYLKDFHTNLDYEKMDIDDIVSFMQDNIPGKTNESYEYALLNMMPIREKNEALEDFRSNTNYFFEDDVNESTINRFITMKRNGYQTIIEANGRDNNSYSDRTNALPTDNDYYTKDDPRINDLKKLDRDGNEYDLDDKDKEKLVGSPVFTDGNKLPPDYFNDINRNRYVKTSNTSQNINKDITAPNNNDRLLSTEVKKANEVQPTLMLVNTIDPDTGINMQSVIGVKSRIITVPSNEIVGRILANYEDSNLLLKFIKLTTREISFIKDFLFAVDNAKLDAINNSRKGSSSSLFRALERRAQNGKIRRLAKTEKQFAKAISALVVSQEDLEELQKYNNIDMNVPRNVIKIMESLNLLYFVVVDESAELIKIFIDGATEYEEYSFSALEKEGKDDNYKKVLNLMTKMR